MLLDGGNVEHASWTFSSVFHLKIIDSAWPLLKASSGFDLSFLWKLSNIKFGFEGKLKTLVQIVQKVNVSALIYFTSKPNRIFPLCELWPTFRNVTSQKFRKGKLAWFSGPNKLDEESGFNLFLNSWCLCHLTSHMMGIWLTFPKHQ